MYDSKGYFYSKNIKGKMRILDTTNSNKKKKHTNFQNQLHLEEVSVDHLQILCLSLVMLIFQGVIVE